MDNDILIILLGAGSMGLIFYVVSQFMAKRNDGKLRDRLKGGGKFSVSAAQTKKDAKVPVKELLTRIGQMAAAPFMPKTRREAIDPPPTTG